MAGASGSSASPGRARRSRSTFRKTGCSDARRAPDMSTILIVEDNEKNMKLVRDVLQAKGYTTVEAATAEDGVRLAGERVPDLILMDIHLPGMSGVDALKLLRADASTARIPIAAVTASVMQQ